VSALATPGATGLVVDPWDEHNRALVASGRPAHACPTHAEAIRKLGDDDNRPRLTPAVKRLYAAGLRWTR
jgi:hypothetical protein